MAPTLKLHYFDLPGKAEVTRLLLTYGGVPFEDAVFPREAWPELKAKMPFGQVPVLEVDGQHLAQSSAIERYAAKLAGLAPEDPWQAAKVDELVAFQQEILDQFLPSYSIQDAEAKVAARKAVVEGPLKPRLEKLTQILEAAGGEFFTGSKVTYADILTFKNLSALVGGTLDGVPTDLLDSYPALKAFHNRVAALPAIAKYYESVTEGPRLAYKPLP